MQNMKFTIVVSFLAAVVLLVGAVPTTETNAFRLARGLPPLPPIRRGTHAYVAKRGGPSGTPGQCNAGSTLCCNRVGQGNDPVVSAITGLLGLQIPTGTSVGISCSPLSLISGGTACGGQTVCCNNNNFNGLIAIGCLPISINL